VGIEALILGKTVVASGAGALKEVFSHGKNGYLFEAGNHESCLNILKSVLSKWPYSLLPLAVLREDYERRFSFEPISESLRH
jgi:glycosyltransferase involved in cell wall biosynthesis